MERQDKQGVRKPSDVERKYDLGGLVKAFRELQKKTTLEMELNTEYLTHEKLMGEPVYTKLVEQDISMRGSTTNEFEAPYQIIFNVQTPNFEKCVRANAYTTGYTKLVLPQISENGYMIFKSMSADKVEVAVKNYLFTNDAHLYIQVWYTKTK